MTMEVGQTHEQSNPGKAEPYPGSYPPEALTFLRSRLARCLAGMTLAAQ